LDENLVTSTGVSVWVPVPLEVKSNAVPANAFGKLVASFKEFAFKAITKYVEPLVRPPTAALPAAYLTFDPVLCPWLGIVSTSVRVSTSVTEAKVLADNVPTGTVVVIEKVTLSTVLTVYCVLLSRTFNPVK
jgi:hypothetical protein